MRFMFVFGLLGMFLAALAMRLTRDAHGAWWWLVSAAGYLASCFLAVAAIYGLRAAGFSVEDIPRRSVKLAADAGEALARVRAVRPFAIPSREQKAALMKYLASARLDRAISNLSPTETP
jgi:hypothetical protein